MTVVEWIIKRWKILRAWTSSTADEVFRPCSGLVVGIWKVDGKIRAIQLRRVNSPGGDFQVIGAATCRISSDELLGLYGFCEKPYADRQLKYPYFRRGSLPRYWAYERRHDFVRTQAGDAASFIVYAEQVNALRLRLSADMLTDAN